MGTLTFNHDDVPSWKIIQPIDRNNGVGIESDDSSNPPQLQLERLSLSHKAEAASVVLAGNSGVAEDGAVVKRAAAGAAGARGGRPAPRKEGREADNDDLAFLGLGDGFVGPENVIVVLELGWRRSS
jgi:hypothetical protein